MAMRQPRDIGLSRSPRGGYVKARKVGYSRHRGERRGQLNSHCGNRMGFLVPRTRRSDEHSQRRTRIAQL